MPTTPWANARTITATRAALLQRDGDRCCYCGQPLGDRVPDVDHAVPRALGGSDLMLNLRLSHARCNRRAGAIMRNTRRWTPTPITITAPPVDEWTWLNE